MCVIMACVHGAWPLDILLLLLRVRPFFCTARAKPNKVSSASIRCMKPTGAWCVGGGGGGGGGVGYPWDPGNVHQKAFRMLIFFLSFGPRPPRFKPFCLRSPKV